MQAPHYPRPSLIVRAAAAIASVVITLSVLESLAFEYATTQPQGQAVFSSAARPRGAG